MARRIRLVKLDKQQRMNLGMPGGMSLFIIMCAMMVALVLWLPKLMSSFTRPAAITPGGEPPSPTEEMKAGEKPARPKTPPRPYVALPDAEEAKLLSTVKDQAPKEKKPYFYLLAKVNAMTDAQIDAAVDPSITYDTFATESGPVRARGKVVKLRGLLLRLKETKMIDSLESGFDSVWEGNIIDDDLRVTLFILTQAPPPNAFHPKDDNVAVRGIYLKNVVYQDRGGGFTATPLIIAKDLVKIVAPPAKQTYWTRNQQYILIGVIIIGVMAVMLFEHRRRVRTATAGLRRRTPSEPLEVVPDEEPAEESQHVNPGPPEGTTSEEKAKGEHN